MPRISLWKPQKGNDYYFSDSVLRDYFLQGGTGVYLHKYIGPSDGGDETTIQDILFLENRNRKYSDHIYELRGAYTPESSEFDLSQFGIFIANDTIFITFHYTDMLNTIGRKIMAGDVIELPHMVDPDGLDEDGPVTKRFYSVTDAMHASEGYGVGWWSHIWRVKAKMVVNSTEFTGVLNPIADENTLPYGPDVRGTRSKIGTVVDSDGEVVGEVCCDNGGSTKSKDQEITDGIIAEAYSNVRFDPKWFDDGHMFLEYDAANESWLRYPWTGDGIPPNGNPLIGSGDTFPEDAVEAGFFLRTDYTPERLFQKEGSIWRKVEDDWRKVWTGYNKVLDTFIDNTDTTTLADGTTPKVRKALSKTVKPKVNLHADKESEIKNNNGGKPK